MKKIPKDASTIFEDVGTYRMIFDEEGTQPCLSSISQTLSTGPLNRRVTLKCVVTSDVI